MEQAATTPVAAHAESRWGGGVDPWGMGWRKLMMWWFIVTDALLFAGFLAGYGFARLAAGEWPDQAEVFHMSLITLMTFILISSSATMATAVAAARMGDSKLLKQQMLFTLIGGAVFLTLQGVEWAGMLGDGYTLAVSPDAPRAFGAYFFVVTGFHGTHVLIGLLVNFIVFMKAKRGTATPEGVELAGLYWHFVDLVWVFIFGCFYLI